MPLSIRVVPQCIKHYPGAILDVVLSTAVSNNPLESPTEISSVSNTEERLRAPTMNLDLETEIVQRLASSLTSKIQTQLRTTSNGYELIAQAIKDGQVDPSDLFKTCFHELKTEMIKNMELSTRVVELAEKKEPHNQSLDQMELIRRRVHSLLTRNYDLYENPTPRLFFALPLVHPSSWNSQDPFSNTFRLYFLCDCGEHTMSTKSRTTHHIHLAKHDGYDITHPKEFFQEYGLHVLTVLQMLKFGISASGITVPTLSQLVRPDVNDACSASLRFLESIFESGIDFAMEHVKKVYEDKRAAVGFVEQVDDNEVLRDVDLARLETFLKNKDKKEALGNLYRSVTTNGHVKWLCIDHYREGHQEAAAEMIRNTVGLLSGSFDENTGRVDVTLQSGAQADQLCLALEKARSVHELQINFSWSTSKSDFRRLRNVLARTNVSVLHLNLFYMDGPTSDASNLDQRHDPILDIMRLPSLQTVIISNAKDFIKRSTLQSRNDDFSNLRHLDICIYPSLQDLDIPALKKLAANAPNLSNLVLRGVPNTLRLQLYNAIAEHQTYPISFMYPHMRILPLADKPPLHTVSLQSTGELLKALCERIEIVELTEEELDGSTAAAFAKATENGSRLKELILGKADRDLGEHCIRDLANIVTRSQLHKLSIDLEREDERVYILESVQWKHIRELTIRMDEGSHGMSPLKAVVNGMEMVSGRIEMDHFELHYEASHFLGPPNPLSTAQEQLLISLVASISLKHLQLDMTMTLCQVISLLKSANLSRLEHIILFCSSFTSSDVDIVLGKLQHATNLSGITLDECNVTNEQIERMKAKGIALDYSRPSTWF
jgi:hypothetical protein